MALQPPQLVAISEGPNIVLDKPILLIGRHQECDIQIASRKISRRHCCIAQVDDQIVVRDLCSTNGIRINGVRVHEGRLKPGDELTIGHFRYHIHWFAYAGIPMNAPALAALDAPRMSLQKEEDPLESCDEPIPLAEPEASLPYRSQGSFAPPAVEQKRLPPPPQFPKLALSDSGMNSPK